MYCARMLLCAYTCLHWFRVQSCCVPTHAQTALGFRAAVCLQIAMCLHIPTYIHLATCIRTAMCLHIPTSIQVAMCLHVAVCLHVAMCIHVAVCLSCCVPTAHSSPKPSTLLVCAYTYAAMSLPTPSSPKPQTLNPATIYLHIPEPNPATIYLHIPELNPATIYLHIPELNPTHLSQQPQISNSKPQTPNFKG